MRGRTANSIPHPHNSPSPVKTTAGPPHNAVGPPLLPYITKNPSPTSSAITLRPTVATADDMGLINIHLSTSNSPTHRRFAGTRRPSRNSCSPPCATRSPRNDNHGGSTSTPSSSRPRGNSSPPIFLRKTQIEPFTSPSTSATPHHRTSDPIDDVPELTPLPPNPASFEDPLKLARESNVTAQELVSQSISLLYGIKGLISPSRPSY